MRLMSPSPGSTRRDESFPIALTFFDLPVLSVEAAAADAMTRRKGRSRIVSRLAGWCLSPILVKDYPCFFGLNFRVRQTSSLAFQRPMRLLAAIGIRRPARVSI